MEKDWEFSTPKRQSNKTQSLFNTYPLWKRKLRDNCYKRVREDRSRLLWKLRSPASDQSSIAKDFIKSAFQDIVCDELQKMNHSLLDVDSEIPTSYPNPSDILWEYDGLHDAYQGDCEEMLLEMQRIFYEDLNTDGLEKPFAEPENDIDTWEDEEDEYLARAVFENMRLNDEQVNMEIWCPICKHGQLQENLKLICCSLCELQLRKGDEDALLW